MIDIEQLKEANKLIFVKEYHEAEKIINGMLHESDYYPNLLIHLRSIELSVRVNKIEELREFYRERLGKDQDDMVADIGLALLEQHGEIITPLEAVARFQELLKKYGADSAISYGIGFSMEVASNFDRALYNYEQCISLDPSFYPGFFGLSQVHYQIGNESKGDYYFKLFEEAAPYNVYGNFETHRNLSNEFLENDRFDDAERAMRSLSEWWVDNRGGCPPEIQIYESYSLARIAEFRGDHEKASYRKTQAHMMVNQTIDDSSSDEGILYFIAKTLEEFADFETALRVYKSLLSMETVQPETVQKIGSQFLSMGEYTLSEQLFEHAYQKQPDNPEIRFCLLVAKLKLANVNVEEYLLEKERMRKLLQNSGDRVELLSLLHSLASKFDEDAEVHEGLAECYERLGNHERASRHIERMYDLDGGGTPTALKYAAHQIQNGDAELAVKILESILDSKKLTSEQENEIFWLRATYFIKAEDYQRSRQFLEKALTADPWNVSYAVYDIVTLTHLVQVDSELKSLDSVTKKLFAGDENNLDWEAYDRNTERLEKHHQYRLAYARDKLRYLYTDKDEKILTRLVKRACKFDATKATYDFLRLLNTNFDGPEIYWALGMLNKENWQLETASMWLEQILVFPNVQASQRGRAFLELADCYNWRNVSVDKSIEYSKLAMSFGESADSKALTVLAHANLKHGQVRQAEVYLEDHDCEDDFEASYLRGLVCYRNGDHQRANEIWKPLLTVRTESLRFHHIKQEIMKYYFEKSPYLKAN